MPIVMIAMIMLSGACGADPPASESSATTSAVEGSASPSAATSTIARAPSTTVSSTLPSPSGPSTTSAPVEAVRTGAGVLVDRDLDALAGQRVGLIVNQTAVVDGRHLIDVVHEHPDVELVAVFAPEHGVRGRADAGELVADTVDDATGAPVVSLYGSTRRPTAESLAGIDVLVYDLQDVGTRFYTYISTMGLAMQAAAEAGIAFVVLDRPNPLGGDSVAGFTRDAEHDSFIGQYPIPGVYGLTAGELATAIVGEQWLPGLEDLDLRVIEIEGWSRDQRWPATQLEWIGPSPGLPLVESALAYPGTVLFEATSLSYGKGTTHPFLTIGAPWVDGPLVAQQLNELARPGVRFESVEFTPDPGIAPNPRYAGVAVPGVRYVIDDPDAFEPLPTGIDVLVTLRDHAEAQGAVAIIDRPETFDLLAGTDELRELFLAGASAEEIVAAWQADALAFDRLRAPYLRYD